MKIEQTEAQYRVMLKRIISAARGPINPETPTPELEQVITEIIKVAPDVVARGLERKYEDAARAWVRGNNSGNSETLAVECAKCEQIRELPDRLLLAFDVTVDYPGLHPSFQWRGHWYYDTKSLLRYVSQSLNA